MSLGLTLMFTTSNLITREVTYFKELVAIYHCGTAEKIPIKGMLLNINDCLSIYQNRSIVLVEHGVSNAGNGANFTLRSSLILGIKAIGAMESSETLES